MMTMRLQSLVRLGRRKVVQCYFIANVHTVSTLILVTSEVCNRASLILVWIIILRIFVYPYTGVLYIARFGTVTFGVGLQWHNMCVLSCVVYVFIIILCLLIKYFTSIISQCHVQLFILNIMPQLHLRLILSCLLCISLFFINFLFIVTLLLL